MKSYKNRMCRYYIILLLVPVSQISAADIKIPFGFESLARGQIVWLDVSAYGSSLGNYPVRVSLDKLTFIKPDDLVKAIGDRFNNSPRLIELVRKRIYGSFNLHSRMTCNNINKSPGCGFMETNGFDIIYDENNARVSLFFPENLINLNKKNENFYQSTPGTHNGIIHQQNVNISSEGNYQSLSVQGNGTLGLSESSYADIDWSWQMQRYKSSSIQDVYINNAYVRHDFFKRLFLQVGLLDSRDIFGVGSINLSLLTVPQISGFRVGSTQSWINNSKIQRGTPVTVLLTRQSRVDAYRGTTLLGSFYLDAGTNQLDTRSFPIGSYNITLKIYENGKLVRTHEEPFVNMNYSLLNNFQWFFQGGSISNVNNSSFYTSAGEKIVQGGMRFPITDTFSVTTGATAYRDSLYFESAVDWSHGFNSELVDGLLSGRFSYLSGSDDSTGNIQQLSYNDGFSLGFYRTQTKAAECNNTGSGASYNGCYMNSNISLSIPISQWQATLGYTDVRQEGRYVYRNTLTKNEEGYNEGNPWDLVYITRSRSRNIQLGLNHNFHIGSVTLNANVNFFVRNDSSYTDLDRGEFISLNIYNANSHSIDSDEHTSSYMRMKYENSVRDGNEMTYAASYSKYPSDENGMQNEEGVSFSATNSKTLSTSIWNRIDRRYGTASSTLTGLLGNDQYNNRLSLTGNYSSSLLIDSDGFYLGRWGNGMPSAAITVGVDAAKGEHAGVDISLDTGDESEIKGNAVGLFMTPGFRETTLNIRESSKNHDGASSEIRKGAGIRKVFMLPGQIYNRHTSVSSLYSWLVRPLDKDGRPLKGSVPLNVLSWSDLDEKGTFMLESETDLSVIYFMRSSRNDFIQCSIKTRVLRDNVHFVGAINCVPVSYDSLPKAEKKQVKMMAMR